MKKIRFRKGTTYRERLLRYKKWARLQRLLAGTFLDAWAAKDAEAIAVVHLNVVRRMQMAGVVSRKTYWKDVKAARLAMAFKLAGINEGDLPVRKAE